MQSKKLLILTGPQGSGNHLFSRLFSLHPDVKGWDALHEKYWVPSDEEPFATFWSDPEQLTADVFEDADYFLANVSCPFFNNGIMQIPKIIEVIKKAKEFGIEVIVGIIVRDQTINQYQHIRLLGHTTILTATEYYKHLMNENIFFINFEAFFLYKDQYLKQLSNQMQFPIAFNDTNIFKYISEDSNKKYIKPITEHWLDSEIKKGRLPKNHEDRN
jgi:hypothetical protein